MLSLARSRRDPPKHSGTLSHTHTCRVYFQAGVQEAAGLHLGARKQLPSLQLAHLEEGGRCAHVHTAARGDPVVVHCGWGRGQAPGLWLPLRPQGHIPPMSLVGWARAEPWGRGSCSNRRWAGRLRHTRWASPCPCYLAPGQQRLLHLSAAPCSPALSCPEAPGPGWCGMCHSPCPQPCWGQQPNWTLQPWAALELGPEVWAP